MSSSQAASSLAKPFRTLLLVICGKGGPLNGQATHRGIQGHARPTFQVNENFGTCPQLEVQILQHPTQQELGQTLKCLLPDIVFFHADLSTGNGALVVGEVKFSQPETLVNLFSPSKFPDLVYLEANAGGLGPALCKAGVPHVVYWDYAVSQLVAYHFCQSLVAALRSARSGIQEAFDLASSSMLMHCTYNRVGRSSNGETEVIDLRPHHSKRALDENHPTSQRPKVEGESAQDELADLPTILQIYDSHSEVRLLVCTEPNRMDKPRLRALETGITALLIMEASGIRLLHRISAPPPPMAAAAHARGIVTMRCDLCTSSYARIPLLVSGSANTCFDDQLLENSIKKEMVKKDGLVRLSASNEDRTVAIVEQRRSCCLASGAVVVEIRVVTHHWAVQMLRQLSSQPSFRSLAALGIAGVDGIPVAAFCKHDADHLSSLLENETGELQANVQDWCGSFSAITKRLSPPGATRKRSKILLHKCPANDTLESARRVKWTLSRSNAYKRAPSSCGGVGEGNENAQERPCVGAAMRPVPHAKQRDTMPYSAAVIAGSHVGWSMKLPLTNGICGRAGRTDGVPGHSGLLLGMHGQALADRMSSQLSFPLEFPLVKPHGCNRKPMAACSEDGFLKDVVEFLISRGHGRLIPPAGIHAFPEVILNAKRLDLYNLYKEVVSRGGFHVGNGINWKGQVFSKMQNHTSSNKMTGVGNALKKHYETYLLEYEFAHDDVDGECCIICHNGAEGDWVNCGVCGEWAHVGCDKRVGLATFKEYAKADGVEYICPRCSAGNGRTDRKSKMAK